MPASGNEERARPVTVTLNGTAAQLLARLCAEMDTEDVQGVLVRALGLFEMVQRARRQGGRLLFRNERGEESDVVA